MPTLQSNQVRLDSFENLEFGWYGPGTKPIDPRIITRCRDLIEELWIQPHIYAVPNNSIQLEYQKPNGDYLEFEISIDCASMFMVIGDKEFEQAIELDYALIDSFIERFYMNL